MVVRGRVQKKALIWFIATCSCILNHGQCQLQRQRLLLSACCLSPNCCLRIYSLDQSLGYLGLASANNGQHYVVMLQESAIQIVTNCYANLFPRLGHCLVKQWLKHRLSKWRPIWAYSICAHIYSVSTFSFFQLLYRSVHDWRLIWAYDLTQFSFVRNAIPTQLPSLPFDTA